MTTPLENATKAAERSGALLAHVQAKHNADLATVAALKPSEGTSPQVASIAAKGLANPESLDHEEIKSVCACALSQTESAP